MISESVYFEGWLLGLIFWGSITLAIAIKRNKSLWWFFAGVFHGFGVLMVLCTSTKEDEYRALGQEHDRLFDSTKTRKPSSGTAASFNDRGVVCVDQKLYSMAITNFSKAIELSPNFARPYYNRALVFEQQEKKQEAITDYEKYITLNDLPSFSDEAKNKLSILSSTDN